MSTRGKGTEFKELIDPATLLTLVGNDRVVLRMENDNELLAYSDLIEGVTRSVTGLEELGEIRTFTDFYTTVDGIKKVFVIHAVGMFENRVCNHLIMVVKKSIYVVAVGTDVGWKEVKDSAEYPVHGARNFPFPGGYYGALESGKLRLGFKELKRSILKLIFEEPTAVDLLCVALNVCEAVRFPFIAKEVKGLIGKLEILERCEPCAKCIFLVDHWRDIAVAIVSVQHGMSWEFEHVENVIDGIPFVTKESVFDLVRVIQKSEKVMKAVKERIERERKKERSDRERKKIGGSTSTSTTSGSS